MTAALGAPETLRLLHEHYDWAAVETLSPGLVSRMILHAAEREAEEVARPIWYASVLASMLDKRRKPVDYNEFRKGFKIQKTTQEKPQKTAAEVMAELMPIAEKARKKRG